MEDTKKKVLIVVAVLVIVGVGGYFLLSNQQVQESLQREEEQPSESEGEAPAGEVSEETRDLIEDAQRRAEEEGEDSRNTVTWQEEGEGTTTATATGVRVADGSSPINTETGRVMTDEGEEADNTAEPGRPDAPGQSLRTDKEDVPEGSIMLDMDSTSITPEEFTVNAGEAVSLAVTATGDSPVVFKFRTDELSGVAVGVESGETRIIPFNAPDEAGEYEFYSDVPTHNVEGTMIVE